MIYIYQLGKTADKAPRLYSFKGNKNKNEICSIETTKKQHFGNSLFCHPKRSKPFFSRINIYNLKIFGYTNIDICDMQADKRNVDKYFRNKILVFSYRKKGQHRSLGNTAHPYIRKGVQLIEIAEYSQMAIYYQNPIWKVKSSRHC